MWTLAGLAWWNSAKNASSHCLRRVFTTITKVYEDCFKLSNLCLYLALFSRPKKKKKTLTHLFTHTCSYHSHVNTAAPHLCVPSPRPLLSIFPLPLYPSLLCSLCCCKAFPWLAVINLPSLGAGSWLRASECSYKAKTAIQKQSRFSCFQSTT